MSVVTWNDHIDVIEEGGETKSKVHKELTVLSWDELAAHDCSMYLQGSIAYNINEQKLAVWDGSTNWIDTDGESHAGGTGVVACTLDNVSALIVNLSDPSAPPEPFDYTSDTLVVQDTPAALMFTSADDPETPLLTDMTNIVSENPEVATAEVVEGGIPLLEVTNHVPSGSATTTISVDFPSKGCTLIMNVRCETIG